MTIGANRRTLVLAHRGDHRRRIENTADALLDACRLPGIDGVEFDVRMAADGEPVILHDETLARSFGAPIRADAVPALTLMQHGVPRLADIFALLPASAFLDIELKETPTRATFEVILGARGTELNRAVISSFLTPVVAEVRGRFSRVGCAGSTRWNSIAGPSRPPVQWARPGLLPIGRR